MSRLLVAIRYDGTAYHGWQVQPNGVTVQERVQDGIEALFGSRLDVTGCSRTDAGVHAETFCFHMDVDTSLPPERLPEALNAHLPDDIVAFACRPVPDGFHARYSCRGKQYAYRFYDGAYRDPFCARNTFPVKERLDVARMDAAAKAFLGMQDFSAFCAAGSSVENKIRTVSRAEVERVGNQVVFTVAADGFLYHMVRSMAGTLWEASRGVISPDDVKDVIASRSRPLAGPTVPAKGLSLQRVFYDEEEWVWQ